LASEAQVFREKGFYLVVAPIHPPLGGIKVLSHPPKPYDIVQGMERIIDMMEETLQICERAQHSMQDASHRKTFPFGLRPSSDVYARHTAKSIQIQFG
jgi:D-mannonate dehydratase